MAAVLIKEKDGAVIVRASPSVTVEKRRNDDNPCHACGGRGPQRTFTLVLGAPIAQHIVLCGACYHALDECADEHLGEQL